MIDWTCKNCETIWAEGQRFCRFCDDPNAKIRELEAKLAGAEIKNSRLRSERESLQVRFALVQNAILPVASWYAVERGRNVEDVVSDIVHDLIRDRAEALKRQEDRRKIGDLEAKLAAIQITWRERIGSGNPAGNKGDGWWVRMEKAITAREEKC